MPGTSTNRCYRRIELALSSTSIAARSLILLAAATELIISPAARVGLSLTRTNRERSLSPTAN
jgi:hypothetical protein